MLCEIYTDGACSGNPGHGGWAIAVYIDGQLDCDFNGSKKHTTNNEMELTAFETALQYGLKYDHIKIYTDSAYIVNCLTQQWYIKWLNNGWKTTAKTPVANKDLWESILRLWQRGAAEVIKVEAHADNKKNNYVDELAVEARNAAALNEDL